MATTNYTLTCLSPVHVGTGTQFTKFEGVYEAGRWHLIDLDRVLARGVNANQLATAMSDRDFLWATWLSTQRISPADVAAYSVPCPQDPNEVPVREAMKTVHAQPYLPGTSIKGAIRTAVLWRLLQEDDAQRTFAARYVRLCLKAQEVLRALRERRAFDRPEQHRAVLAEVFSVTEEEAQALQRTLYRIANVEERHLAGNWRTFQRRLESLGRSREWLAQPVERIVLGADPTHDLLRAVHVSDTQPVSIEQLAVGLVWTYTLRGNRLVEKREQDGEYKIFVEWLTPETPLRVKIAVDDFLFSEVAESELRFRGDKEQAVRQLAHTCNAYARSVIAAEHRFYTDYPIHNAGRELSTIREFYAELETSLNNLPEGAFLLNIGWGGGWEVKTIGDLLRTELGEDNFNQVRQHYRLGQNPRTRQPDTDHPFPKTRHIGYEHGAPMWPLGWVKLTPSGGRPMRTILVTVGTSLLSNAKRDFKVEHPSDQQLANYLRHTDAEKATAETNSLSRLLQEGDRVILLILKRMRASSVPMHFGGIMKDKVTLLACRKCLT